MTTDLIREALDAATEFADGGHPFDVAALARGEHGDFPLTETGQAELFVFAHGHRVRYDHKRQRWLTFRGHHWREDRDGELYRLAIETARLRREIAAHIEDPDRAKPVFSFALQAESQAKIKAVLGIAQTLPPIADNGEGWDEDPDLLGVANGVIDLRTSTLRPGYPADRITKTCPIAFDPTASAPTWERAVEAMMSGDRQLVDFLQVAAGYSLTGHTREQVLLVAHGSGANGKSTFLNIVRAAAGDYAVNMAFSAVEMVGRSQLTPELAMLPGKRLVTSSETNDGSRLNEARVKALTGGDTITANPKNRDPFEFRPVVKLWLATNHLPSVRDDSHGFWRRLRLIPFRHQFSGEEMDPNLEGKLMAELPGVLRWMVEGARRWYAAGLVAPDTVLLATDAYRADSDPLADFIAERCVISEVAQTRAGDLYKTYLSWANEHSLGRETLTPTRFGKRLAERFERLHTRDGKAYRGIGLAFDVTGSSAGDGFEVGFASLAPTASVQARTDENPSQPVTGPRNRSNEGYNTSTCDAGDGLGGHSQLLEKSNSRVRSDLQKGSQPVTPSHEQTVREEL